MNPLKSRVLWAFLLLSAILKPAAATVISGHSGPAAAILPVEGAPVDEKNKNAIDEISEGLVNHAGSHGDRTAMLFFGFIWDGHIDSTYRNKMGEEDKKLLGQHVKDWVTKEIASKDEARVRGVATLYHILTFSKDNCHLQGFIKNLTENPGGQEMKLKQGNRDEWLQRFFKEAIKCARKNLGAVCKTGSELLDGIRKREEPVLGDPSGGKKIAYGQGFDIKSLYLDGAVVQLVAQPGEEANAREISIKMFSRKGIKGEPPIVNELGICDLGNRSDIVCQRVSLDRGNQTFQLDNRDPLNPKYTLSMEKSKEEGKMRVIFGRPNSLDNKGRDRAKWQRIETSVQDLYVLRARQIVKEGRPINVNGRNFLVIGQGSHYGALLYFDPASEDVKKPAMMAYITERVAGDDEKLSNKPRLGKIDGEEWHLKLHPPTSDYPKGYWEAEKGEGDPDPDLSPGDKEEEKKDEPRDGRGGRRPPPKEGDKDKSDEEASNPEEDKDKDMKGPLTAKCDKDVKFEGTIQHELDGWTFFTHGTNSSETYICMNKTQAFLVRGYLLTKGIRKERDGKYLVVDLAPTVKTNPKFIDLKDGLVEEESLPPAKPDSVFTGREIYYIPVDNLTPAYVAKWMKGHLGHYPEASQLAEVKLEMDLLLKRPSSIAVYTPEAAKDPKSAVKAVGEAIEVFAIDSPLRTFYQGDSKALIEKYVLEEAEKYKGIDISSGTHFTINPYMGNEVKTKDNIPFAITPSVKDEKVDYEELEYCWEGKLHLETASDHEKHVEEAKAKKRK